jgi:hypothetical protein
MLWAGLGSLAEACSIHGSTAAEAAWVAASGSGGVVQGSLTLESTLIVPTSSTVCIAGIGLGSLDEPAPSGLNVTGLAIVVVDPTDGSRTPLAAFSFAPDAATSAALAAGSGSSSVPNTNPLFPGAAWFGFSSLVDPFPQPLLGPGEYTAFEFAVELPASLLPLALAAQFAGGEGRADGTPIFDGDHPAQYFAAANPIVAFVPEPGAHLIAVFAALCVSFVPRREIQATA